MITIRVDGQTLNVPEGISIIEAARLSGVDIPALGYDPRVSPPSGAELSTVELLEGERSRFVSATGTTVAEGMEIRTKSPALENFRQIFLGSLLRNHYGDCEAPCSQRCPAHIDIQKYLYHVAAGNFREAFQVIVDSNPLPSTCSRVCPHPCESECRRNAVGEAVNINGVKRFVADWNRKHPAPYRPSVAPDTGKRVAVIGGGPAGLTAAYFLRRMGHSPVVFEMNEKAGGMLRYGIPYYRLPEEVLDAEIQSILDLGVELRCNKKLGRDFSLETLKLEGFDAVFAGLGAQKATPIGCPGDDLKGVWSGLDMLARVARHERIDLGDAVCVVGGGNTAIDAARTALRLGSKQVTLVYRRTRKEMPALPIEVEEALEEGVTTEFLAAPVKIESKGDRLALTCVRMQLGEPDASGRRKPVPVEGSEFEILCTAVVAAIGQKVAGEEVGLGAHMTRGALSIDGETYATKIDGVFAGGDCVTGPDIAVSAIGAGQKAAKVLDEYLRTGKVAPRLPDYTCTKGRWDELPEEEFRGAEAKKRHELPVMAAEERVRTFDETTGCWDAKTAMAEAGRCLSCGCSERYDCQLRGYASNYGVTFDKTAPRPRPLPVDDSHPILVRDSGKCILCGLCLKVCREMEGSAALSFSEVGSRLTIGPNDGRPLEKTTCVSCGHCVTVCPTGALAFRPVLPEVYRALHDPMKITAAQIAPAVRAALAEKYGVSGEEAMKRLCAGLRLVGFDYVFDTCFTADLTIMEEGTEFLSRVSSGQRLPQFTSCCPAWVQYCEKVAPDLLNLLSSCKSPQQMFGAVVKEYFAKQIDAPRERLHFVSIMPCNAKKYEAKRPEFAKDGSADVDTVLTTNDILQMFEEKNVDFLALEPRELDQPFGKVSGAGIIFGASGGVSEAALRLAADKISGERLENVEYEDVRGLKGIKEARVRIGDKTVRVAVVSGLQNAQRLIDRIRGGDIAYDLIEVMACPGGCINGSGNPAPKLDEERELRLEVLYKMDEETELKKSQDNPAVQRLYSQWLGQPVSEISHHALHTTYGRRSMRVEETVEEILRENQVVDIAVCVSTNCYIKGSWRVLEGLAAELRRRGLSEKFRVRARFCAQNCDHGPTVTIGKHSVTKVDPSEVEKFVDLYLAPALKADKKTN